jgi:hypothetical protein
MPLQIQLEIKLLLLAAVYKLNSMEAFHADYGKEVVNQHQDEHGRRQAWHEDDGGAEHVAEATLHSQQRKKPDVKGIKSCHTTFNSSQELTLAVEG